jgi:hypothetical protein
MPSKEVTRTDLRRALVLNAAARPLNVAVGAAVAVAGILLSQPWLLGVAAVVYVLLSVLTFFDGDEAEKVGRRLYGSDARRVEAKRLDLKKLAVPIAGQVNAARAEEQRIRAAVQDADLPFTEVSTETDSLMSAMEKIAVRAQRVYAYLESQDTPRIQHRLAELQAQGGNPELISALSDQLAVQERLRDQLNRFYGAMEHLTTSLGTIHGQLVAMSVAGEDAAQAQLAGEVRHLREQVNAVSEGMREVYAQAEEPA